MTERPLHEIWFCYGCVREVLAPRHCGRPATRMYSMDFTPGGRDITPPLATPAPGEFVDHADEEEQS